MLTVLVAIPGPELEVATRQGCPAHGEGWGVPTSQFLFFCPSGHLSTSPGSPNWAGPFLPISSARVPQPTPPERSSLAGLGHHVWKRMLALEASRGRPPMGLCWDHRCPGLWLFPGGYVGVGASLIGGPTWEALAAGSTLDLGSSTEGQQVLRWGFRMIGDF